MWLIWEAEGVIQELGFGACTAGRVIEGNKPDTVIYTDIEAESFVSKAGGHNLVLGRDRFDKYVNDWLRTAVKSDGKVLGLEYQNYNTPRGVHTQLVQESRGEF